MPLKKVTRERLLKLSLPGEDAIRARIRRFVLTSGMTGGEFAEAIGYSQSTISIFLNGRDDKQFHEDSSLAIRMAAKEYMDLHDLQDAYVDETTHFVTTGSEQVRRAVLNALRRGTAYVVDGPPGSEKTRSLQEVGQEIAQHKLGRYIYVYTRIKHTPHSFLQECCCAAGIPSRGNIDQLIRKLRFFLAQGRTVLVIDEAQHLDHATLEILRQLLDLPPFFGVVLSGSHDLTQRLSHWQMEQWRSRVRKTIYLDGPSRDEARKILQAELHGMEIEDCDETIQQCLAKAERVQMTQGKSFTKKYEYISARLLFDAIKHTKETLAQPNAAQPEGAAA